VDFKEAEAIAGKLSTPSKMPGYAYGIPARHCPVGKILVKLKGSVCSTCYALKGRYVFPNVKAAQDRRFNSLRDIRWTDAMVVMIGKRADQGHNHFRWHDSGDVQGGWHLEKIVEVAKRLPKVKFWLPTREQKTVKDWMTQHGKFPKNLVVRVSGAMIDGEAPSNFPHVSTVVRDKSKATCPAYRTEGECGTCRACWDPKTRSVSYPLH
jgi:hypothetical protein